jgi:membrane-bound metal-dependent hydrolase YbcI (DUF457 family)
MMAKTHRAGAILTGVLVSKHFINNDVMTTCISLISLFPGVVFGSLLPDIDKKESYIGRRFWFVTWPIYFLRMILKLIIKITPSKTGKSIIKKIYKNTGHRYICHSIITWLFLFICFLLFSLSLKELLPPKELNLHIISFNLERIVEIFAFTFSFGVSIGMLSHLLLDLPTEDGIALLAPFIDFKIRLPLIHIKVSGFTEQIVFLSIVLLTFYKGYEMLSQLIIRI